MMDKRRDHGRMEVLTSGPDKQERISCKRRTVWLETLPSVCHVRTVKTGSRAVVWKAKQCFRLPGHETRLLIHQDYLITFIGEVFSADHFLNIAGSKGVKASLSCRMTRWRRQALAVHTANIS